MQILFFSNGHILKSEVQDRRLPLEIILQVSIKFFFPDKFSLEKGKF